MIHSYIGFVLLDANPLITPAIGLIFWTLVIFLVLLAVLGKFVWPVITKSLADRENSINEALAAAEEARNAKQDLEAKVEAMRQEAREEREKMMKTARETANKMQEEAKQKANAEYNRIIESAKREIELQKENAMAQVRKEVASIAIDVAEKLVRKNLSGDQAQKDLVDTYLKEANLN